VGGVSKAHLGRLSIPSPRSTSLRGGEGCSWHTGSHPAAGLTVCLHAAGTRGRFQHVVEINVLEPQPSFLVEKNLPDNVSQKDILYLVYLFFFSFFFFFSPDCPVSETEVELGCIQVCSF